MNMLKRQRLLKWSTVLIIGISVASGCSCSQDQAGIEYRQQLADRRDSERASLSRYKSAMDDYRDERMEAAEEGLREAIEISDRNVAAWNALGVVSFHQGDFATATRAFQSASRLSPGAYEPHYNLGLVFETMGRFADAIRTYEAGLALDSDALELQENLARTYIRADVQPRRAEELLREALKWENRPEWRKWMELEAIRLRHQMGLSDLPGSVGASEQSSDFAY